MFNQKVYSNRRQNLRKLMKSGFAVFFGNSEASMNYPANPYRFRQDSSFLYFFGLNYPDLVGVIDIDNNTDYIFGNDIDLDDIIWMGNQPTLKEKCVSVGVDKSGNLKALTEFVKSNLKNGRKIHFLPPYRSQRRIQIEELIGIPHSQVQKHASIELIESVVKLRAIKDEYEIKEMEETMDNVTYHMHVSAMKMAKEGVYEREISGFIEGLSMSNGGTVAYPIILSVNGEILHNHYHGNKLKNGQLLLIDAGAESPLGYATDITRTIPVGGRFSQQQKEIYEIVLKAEVDCIEKIKPGVHYKDIHLEAAKIITAGLIDLGIMKGNVEEAVSAGAHAMFFPHGLGHMMGLDVHDMEDLGENYVGYGDGTQRSDQFGLAYLRMARKLEPGHVMTSEPGIYFIPALINTWKNEKKFIDFINYNVLDNYMNFGGIRIEDDVLVTSAGHKIIGNKPIPKTIEDIEKIILP
ncbi:MAG: aminopeptidase P family protein [Chlorobi bacterium]|nr:aminopeptidase P family protein [Chlorobiota bacterium]